MKKKIIIIAIVAILVALTVLVLADSMYKVPLTYKMTMCSSDGKSVQVHIDIMRVKNIIDPVHYEGTITVDKKTYIDHMSRFGIKENYSTFERLKEKWRMRGFPLPYNDFFYPSTGKIDSMFWVSFIHIEEKTYVRFRFNSINYYGPAYSAEEAKKIEEQFSIADNYDENSGW